MEKSEETLISDILAGDADAYAVLVRRYQKSLFNLMLRMNLSQEDAVDLTQETFVRAYDKLDRFKPGKRFFPWLYTIGLNLARDYLRRTKAARAMEEELRGSHSHNVLVFESEYQEALPGDVGISQLKEALQQLPIEYREAIFLRFHEGMTMKEIAKALGISVSGSKMRVHRGLLKLRQLLIGE